MHLREEACHRITPLAFSPLLPPFQGPSAFSTDSLGLFLLDYFVLLCPKGFCLYSCGLCWEFWFYSYNWTPCSFSLFVSPTSSVLGVLQSVRKTTSVFCTRSRILMFPRVGLDSGLPTSAFWVLELQVWPTQVFLRTSLASWQTPGSIRLAQGEARGGHWEFPTTLNILCAWTCVGYMGGTAHMWSSEDNM